MPPSTSDDRDDGLISALGGSWRLLFHCNTYGVDTSAIVPSMRGPPAREARKACEVACCNVGLLARGDSLQRHDGLGGCDGCKPQSLVRRALHPNY